MAPAHRFELQGHRGARGLKPENTLPSFEAALDAGVSSIETDVRLSADGELVLFHDDRLTEGLCRFAPGASAWQHEPLVSSLPMAALRCVLVKRDPDTARWPRQTENVTPLADLFARRHGLPPYAIPTLADLLGFIRAYAGPLGRKAGKSTALQRRADKVRFDLEIKRTPYQPELIGDDYTGHGAGLLERNLVETLYGEKLLGRTTVRSFDHRAVRAVKLMDRRLRGAILIAGAAPVSAPALARLAHAEVYCPDYHSVDPAILDLARARRLKVIPWTVNEPKDWQKLLDWGVDGITTDYPDELAAWLGKQHVKIA